MRASLDGQRYSAWPAGNELWVPPPITGLIFPGNFVAGGDIALDWTTGWDRLNHTSIWQAKFDQQSGYYAWEWEVFTDNAWHSNDGTKHGEFGCHPYPTDGNVNGQGYSSGTGPGGTVHYFEIANGGDKISDPPGSPKQVIKGQWYTQAKTCETVGSDYVHKFYPDLTRDPGYALTWVIPTGSFEASPMKHRNGASPWTPAGSGNQECPSGTFRFFLKYTRALTITEILAKTGLSSNDTTDPDRYYSNINPTPSDVTDKSGRGHDPTWATGNRPTLFST